VAALGAATAGLGQAIQHTLASSSSLLDSWTAAGVSVASGLFLAAGVLRLAKWRLAGDAHSALTGTALLVMGGLCLPLGGFARLFVSGADSSVVGMLIRCLASCLAMRLVLRALEPEDVAYRYRPARLIPGLFALVTLVFMLLIVGEKLLPRTLSAQLLPPALLSALMSVAWLAVAVRVASHSDALPWARRAAPLFLGMGLAEMLRGLDFGTINAWTFSGVVLCACMAALAARSALMDLDGAVNADHHQLSDLSVALHQESGRADELTEWREQLTHDARNACAGLRAAMDILQRYDGRVDPGTTERLRLAAVEEIGHLEHLLFRPSSLPCEHFGVSALVREVGESARALGARVSVDAGHVHGLGRPGDLAAVLKNLLVNAQTHAPGSTLEIRVTATQQTVTIACCDDGPGLSDTDAERIFERGYRGPTSPGSGLGLYSARELMREQGGDLELGEPRPGATFLITLPAAPVRVWPMTPIRVTAQRLLSPAPALIELSS
jgi:signal transduction histidine kinase